MKTLLKLIIAGAISIIPPSYANAEKPLQTPILNESQIELPENFYQEKPQETQSRTQKILNQYSEAINQNTYQRLEKIENVKIQDELKQLYNNYSYETPEQKTQRIENFLERISLESIEDLVSFPQLRRIAKRVRKIKNPEIKIRPDLKIKTQTGLSYDSEKEKLHAKAKAKIGKLNVYGNSQGEIGTSYLLIQKPNSQLTIGTGYNKETGAYLRAGFQMRY